MSERLDQIESILSVLVSHSEATDRRINQLADNQLLIQQDIQLITHWVGGLTTKVEQLTDSVGSLAHQLEQQAEQSEQDRNQAAIDRAEFRSTVQGVLEVLTQRFSSNGHSE